MAKSLVAAYGPWALVTGATRGIGAEFARQLAEQGFNIVLLATNDRLLRKRADELELAYGIRTRTIRLDLAREDIIKAMLPATEDLDIGLLINNAGMSTVGPFVAQTPDYLVRQLHVNARAGLILAHHFGIKMALRQRGGIIFVSSGSAQHGTPYSANYAGTKAYDLILAESLWYELKPYGVDVLAFMCGATNTDGWDENEPKPDPMVPVGEVGPAVAKALRSLGHGPSVANGTLNRLGYKVMGMVSRARAVKILGSSMDKMFGPF